MLSLYNSASIGTPNSLAAPSKQRTSSIHSRSGVDRPRRAAGTSNACRTVLSYLVVLVLTSVLNPIAKKVLANRVYQDCLVSSTRDQAHCIRTVKLVKDVVTISENDVNHIRAFLTTPVQTNPGRVPSAENPAQPQSTDPQNAPQSH